MWIKGKVEEIIEQKESAKGNVWTSIDLIAEGEEDVSLAIRQ